MMTGFYHHEKVTRVSEDVSLGHGRTVMFLFSGSFTLEPLNIVFFFNYPSMETTFSGPQVTTGKNRHKMAAQ